MKKSGSFVINDVELERLVFALNKDANSQPRRFALNQLKLAASIAQKLTPYIVNGRALKGNHSVPFSADEKKLVMDCMKSLSWSIGDAEPALAVIDKLSEK